MIITQRPSTFLADPACYSKSMALLEESGLALMEQRSSTNYYCPVRRLLKDIGTPY